MDQADRKPNLHSIHKAMNQSHIKTNATSTSSYSTSERESCSVDGEFQAFSGSSTSGFSDSSTSENTRSKEDSVDDDCLSEKNGDLILALTGARLWNRFLETGTEMIISRKGRRMFPYVEFFLRGMDPIGMYDVVFDIIPASNSCFRFIKHKWIPFGIKGHEFINRPFKHPDSPSMGCDWMTRKISFQKIRLTNKPDSKAGTFSLHSYQMYVVQISIVKYDRENTVSTTQFPLHSTSFIAVTAYNNREVVGLKISSNPYSKAFRNQVKRMKTQSGASKSPRYRGSTASVQQDGLSLQQQYPLDLSALYKRPGLDNRAPFPDTSEKACQTEITIEEINYIQHCILFSQLKRQFFNSILPVHPYSSMDCITHEKAFDGSAESVNGTICNTESTYRARTVREEHMDEYNTRIEMWKQDKE